MNINCKISSDLKVLNEYNKIYDWIPNENQIRPSDMNIFIKDILKNKIDLEYNSTRDYILINLFNFNGNLVNGKYKAEESNSKLHKFEVNRFKYKLNKKTFHYIMWYNCDKDNLTENEIDQDIRRGIYNLLRTDEYEYVWYENPKMTINDVYHLQVFFIKK
tara:strand:+ start:487 stop:969 length:483 start_codon:yes stop_codon:yes gene_type:complete